MKSVLNYLTIILLVFACGASFSACSDDDGPNIDTPNIESQWQSNDLAIQFQSNNKLAGWNNNGTFSGSYTINESENLFSYDVTFATGRKESGVNKKYIASDNTLTLNFCGTDYTLNKCNETNNSILGKWELVNRTQYNSFYTINILSNGRFEVIYEPGETVEPGGFEWKVNGSNLTLYFDTECNYEDYLTGEFVIIGDEMRYTNNYNNLSDDDKPTATFILKRIK